MSKIAVVLPPPFALVALILSPWPSPESIPCLLVGVGLHVGYQLFLFATACTLLGVGLLRS